MAAQKWVSKGFCTKYNLTKLVYFELFEDMYQAISREKQIKAGSRKAKNKLIESINPAWRDLYQDILNLRRLPRRCATRNDGLVPFAATYESLFSVC